MGNILQDIGRTKDAAKYFALADSLAGGTQSTIAESPPLVREERRNAYQNLWVWGAEINHTYYFSKQNSVWVQSHEANPASDTLMESVSMTCLSVRPLILEIPMLLSPSHCEHIITTAVPLLQSSHVMGASVSGDAPSSSEPYRTSENAWLPRDDILREMQLTLSALLGLPSNYLMMMSEDLQVVKYSAAGQFQLHYDSSAFHPRMATALVYLRDLEPSTPPDNTCEGEARGGETWFPFAPSSSLEFPCQTVDEAMTLARDRLDTSKGLLVQPRQGKAVVFFNHLPDGTLDLAALHAGMKTINSTKWVANYWVKLDLPRLEEMVK